MRFLAPVAVGVAGVAVGMLALSSPRPAVAGPGDPVYVGPVVGEATEFKEKTKIHGNEAYVNIAAKSMTVSIIFEAGNAQASLTLRDAAGKLTLLAQASASVMDRQRAISVDVEPKGSLWVKSEGGTARWQLVAAVPAP